MAVPGILAFMQNPPPITISGQNVGASSYQLTLQSANLQRDLLRGRRSCMARMRQLPGFVDVQSDMQIASPQLMVDIDRDRALVPRHHAAAGAGRALQRLQPARSLGDLRAGQSVLRDSSSCCRNTSARRKRCRRSTCARPNGALVPLDAVVQPERARPARCRSTTSASCPR